MFGNMEGNKTYALLVIFVLICFSFTSCKNNESDFCNTWSFMEISPRMKVFYKEGSTLHADCFSFHTNKNKGTFNITERVIEEYFKTYLLNSKTPSEIRRKK